MLEDQFRLRNKHGAIEQVRRLVNKIEKDPNAKKVLLTYYLSYKVKWGKCIFRLF